ncbi:UNVERIFIED_CONTAM: Kinesin-like protein KIN-14M [Sesamum latifolium]|uniref:Kinesin-like protein KIN-14M n=1 Tax=Sesamum latifolium TaxID=2727402 RepID=A0AAW2TEV9_9LAMI
MKKPLLVDNEKLICIFTYGQTGCGRYRFASSLMGKPAPPDQKGLIPQVFETRQILQAQGWKYGMHQELKMLESSILSKTLTVARRSPISLTGQHRAGIITCICR